MTQRWTQVFNDRKPHVRSLFRTASCSSQRTIVFPFQYRRLRRIIAGQQPQKIQFCLQSITRVPSRPASSLKARYGYSRVAARIQVGQRRLRSNTKLGFAFVNCGERGITCSFPGIGPANYYGLGECRPGHYADTQALRAHLLSVKQHQDPWQTTSSKFRR